MSDLSRTTEEASQVRKEGQQTANDSYQGTETLHRTLVSSVESRTCGAKVEKGRIYTSHATYPISSRLSAEPASDPSKTWISPHRALDPPTTLKRFGPDRKKKWVLNDTDYENAFSPWWLRIEYSRNLDGNGRARIKWLIETNC
ncbi:hypothetical protein Y699_05345 [Aspergillus fumigatus Z5]|nr:hypothetical protein Y699_05345 [Aspergillus fumigatus Z5]